MTTPDINLDPPDEDDSYLDHELDCECDQCLKFNRTHQTLVSRGVKCQIPDCFICGKGDDDTID